MSYGATILYVPDVDKAVDFYHRAFGFEAGFQGEGYAQLAAEGAAIAFAAHSVAPDTQGTQDKPAGFELWIVADDVPAAYARALAAGAVSVHEPVKKPWGQVVAYVRDPNGTLVELGEPVS